MEENNKKGFNTLYLVLGVSTLVVAIIGATFAFFSASQTNRDINGNVAEAGGLNLSVASVTDYYEDDELSETDKFYNSGQSIIPLNLIPNQTKILDEENQPVLDDNGNETYVDAESQFNDAIANKCVDDNGNNICEVYKITVENQSSTATVQVRGTLKLSGTPAPTNLYWKLINASVTPKSASVMVQDPETQENTLTTVPYELLSTATEIEGMTPVQIGETGYVTAEVVDDEENEGKTKVVPMNVTLVGGAETSFYVIVWLEEIGTAQEGVDASNNEVGVRSFTGTVTFDAVDTAGNKSGVTATFNKSSQ